MNITSNILKSALIFLILSAAFSCSNDFLNQEKPVVAPVADTIRMTSLEQGKTVSFNIPNAGNAGWRVFQFPAWAKISPMEGNFSNGVSSFQIEIPANSDIPQHGILSLPLVFDVEGIGYVQYPFLLLNFGNPQPGLSNYNLNLNYQTQGMFTLHNLNGGILLWEVQSKPSWITLSSQGGYMNANSAQIISLTISRDNLAKGDYSGEIVLATNSGINPTLKLVVSIKVFDPTLSGNAELLEGEVVDAAFCKATGALVVAAKNPNRMYLYQSGQVKKQLDFQKIPINVAISEKGDLIVASFTNTDLSVIDPENLTVQKSIPTGMISIDLALGENGWAYLAPVLYDNNNNLTCVDLHSGQLVKINRNLYGLSWLKKVPGKSLLYGSKIGWSPDFLLVFDISQGAVNPVIDEWWTTLYKFWPSEDGQRIFTGMLNVYQSPGYQAKGMIMESPALLGQFESISGSLYSMEHSQALKEIFVACRNSIWEAGNQILRIDDSGYFIKKIHGLNNLTLTENGNVISVTPEIPYMYINKAGKELYLIKVAMGNSGKNYWYYEKIDL